MSVIRGTGLSGYRELVRELGVDPDPLLVRSGLHPEDIGNHDAFIPYLGHISAVESAAEATGCNDFGRRLALRQGIDILGPLGVALRTAATVDEAFRIAAIYLAAYAPALSVSVEPLDARGRSFFEFSILINRLPPHRQSLELALGVVLRVFRFLWGEDYQSTAVHLPHDPLGPRRDYSDYFACTPRFGEPRSGFTLRTADLARPVSRDQVAHDAMVDYLEAVAAGRDRSLSGRVRRLVRSLLPTGTASLDLIADQVAMHPRTFQRRLAAEGTTFNELVDQVRMEVAEQFLRDTDLTMTLLARQLGYAEQSVLTRSCQRWFGRGPAAHRAAIRSEPAPRVQLS